MTDKIETAIIKGKRAAALMNDDLLKEALDAMKKDAQAAWLAAPITDPSAQLAAKLYYHAVEQLEQKLMLYVSNGSFAAKTLDS